VGVDATVDWARGYVVADGVGVADRHAPSPAVARGTSRRGAEDQARKKLAAVIPTIALAAGGTVGERGAAAIAHAVTLSAEPETDGAWKVTLGVPLEALRVAIDGPRAWTAGGDAGLPVVVVKAPKGTTAAVGWRVDGAKVATVFPGRLPRWIGDAPVVSATVTKQGDLKLEKSAGGPATLYVIVTE